MMRLWDAPGALHGLSVGTGTYRSQGQAAIGATISETPHLCNRENPDFLQSIFGKPALGGLFENKEEKLFGKDGFEKIVIQAADLEKRLGIYELAQFTPKV